MSAFGTCRESVWWAAYSVSVAVEHVYTQNGLFAGLSPYCGREGTEGQEGQHDSVGVDLLSTLCSLSVPLWDTVGSVYTIAGSQRRSRGGGGRGGEKAEQEQQNKDKNRNRIDLRGVG